MSVLTPHYAGALTSGPGYRHISPFSLITLQHIAFGPYGRQILKPDKMYKHLSAPQYINYPWKHIIFS